MSISIMDLMTAQDFGMLGVIALSIFMVGFAIGHVTTLVFNKH